MPVLYVEMNLRMSLYKNIFTDTFFVYVCLGKNVYAYIDTCISIHVYVNIKI